MSRERSDPPRIHQSPGMRLAVSSSQRTREGTIHRGVERMMACFGPADAGPTTLAAVVERAARRKREAGCETQSEPGGTRVHLWGILPFSWCGHLALHCHVARVNILDVDARHRGHGHWIASLLLEAASPESQIGSRDFLAMARHRPALVPSQPRIELESFDLAGVRAGAAPSGGSGSGDEESEPFAQLRVRARDRLGLLAGVFQAIQACELRPRELWIRTRDGWAEDWIVLESLAGTAPSVAALEALEQWLDPRGQGAGQRRR